MQFQKSRTFTNLARAFAGECQAGMRYQLAAKLAVAEEYPVLADMIRGIAKNETYHAKTFFDTILQNAGSCDNIDLKAGYPFHFGTLAESLSFAAEDEHTENSDVYPAFAQTAEEEGYPEIAALFNRVAAVEKEHERVFAFLAGAMRDGTLYKRDKPTLWVCGECGWRAMTKEAWKVCPLCKSKQGYVEIPLPKEKSKGEKDEKQ